MSLNYLTFFVEGDSRRGLLSSYRMGADTIETSFLASVIPIRYTNEDSREHTVRLAQMIGSASTVSGADNLSSEDGQIILSRAKIPFEWVKSSGIILEEDLANDELSEEAMKIFLGALNVHGLTKQALWGNGNNAGIFNLPNSPKIQANKSSKKELEEAFLEAISTIDNSSASDPELGYLGLFPPEWRSILESSYNTSDESVTSLKKALEEKRVIVRYMRQEEGIPNLQNPVILQLNERNAYIAIKKRNYMRTFNNELGLKVSSRLHATPPIIGDQKVVVHIIAS